MCGYYEFYINLRASHVKCAKSIGIDKKIESMGRFNYGIGDFSAPRSG
jgi:hypothetical protein